MNALPTADLFSVAGKVAVVTGASSGLGERFARLLGGAGATVVAAACRLDRLEALAGEVTGLVPHAADLSIETDRAALIAFRSSGSGGSTCS